MRKKEASRELDRHRSKLNLSLINVHGEGKKTEHTAGNVVKKKPKTVKRLGEREISTRERERERAEHWRGYGSWSAKGCCRRNPRPIRNTRTVSLRRRESGKRAKPRNTRNKVRGGGEYNINMEKISKKPNYKIKEKKKRKKEKGKKKTRLRENTRIVALAQTIINTRE